MRTFIAAIVWSIIANIGIYSIVPEVTSIQVLELLALFVVAEIVFAAFKSTGSNS